MELAGNILTYSAYSHVIIGKALTAHHIEKVDSSSVSLTYKVKESPRVYLTEINITGTKAYPPLDIERLLSSSEIDCFSWANDSGVFQESKVNQDLQIITQHYLSNGYIKVKIDKDANVESIKAIGLITTLQEFAAKAEELSKEAQRPGEVTDKHTDDSG